MDCKEMSESEIEDEMWEVVKHAAYDPTYDPINHRRIGKTLTIERVINFLAERAQSAEPTENG